MSILATRIKAKHAATGPEPAAVVPVTDEQHQAVIDLVRGRTMEMSFTVHGLPKSRRISGRLADQIAQSVQGSKKSVRSSWSMFTSDHPAVKELNGLLRELDLLRDTWTIVKSAEVKRGVGDRVTIEGGKRLIWDKDVPEFYALFLTKAKQIDRAAEKLEHAMTAVTFDADDEPVPSVMDMDRKNAGEAWDRAAYPDALALTVGVATERNADGTQAHGTDGEPKYVLKFEEYHVSEKLPEMLRERAIQRIEAGLSDTIETAMAYAATELTSSMVTFLGELSERTKVYPPVKSEYHYLYEAEVLKIAKAGTAGVPPGHVKVYLRYASDGDTVSKWVGPLPEAEYLAQLKPQSSGEKRKIYPTVIEGIVTQLRAFKERKAKMLGAYGDNAVAAFDPLLNTLLLARDSNPYLTDAAAAKQLAEALKTSPGAREAVAQAVTDAVERLSDQVVAAKETNRRRTIKASLVGRFGTGELND